MSDDLQADVSGYPTTQTGIEFQRGVGTESKTDNNIAGKSIY
jgi:hypothetical protein